MSKTLKEKFLDGEKIVQSRISMAFLVDFVTGEAHDECF